MPVPVAAVVGTVVVGVCICVLIYLAIKSKKRPLEYGPPKLHLPKPKTPDPPPVVPPTKTALEIISERKSRYTEELANSLRRRPTGAAVESTEPEKCALCGMESLYIVLPCQHKCFCTDCGKISKKKHDAVCPVANCKKPITGYIIKIDNNNSSTNANLSDVQREIKDKYMDKGICIHCKKEKVQFLCVPCGHKCLCINCLDHYDTPQTLFCPFCQQPIVSKVTFFK